MTMRPTLVVTCGLLCACLAHAQLGRTFDWYTDGGDPQRTGVEKTDAKFVKDGVKDFKQDVKFKLDVSGKGPHDVSPAIVLGTLISYKGFKELAFVGSSSGTLWAVDADLDRVFWKRTFDLPALKVKSCENGLGVQTVLKSLSLRGAFGPRPLYSIARDGKFYTLDTSTGKDVIPPVTVFSGVSDLSSANFDNNVLYVTTNENCGSAGNAVWAVDLSADVPKITSFVSTQGGFIGARGPAVGTDGTIYAQTASALYALTPKELKVKQTFALPAPAGKADAAMNETSPVVFSYKGRDVIATMGKDGAIYLFDSKAPAGDNKDFLARSAPVAASGTPMQGVLGSLSTWEDAAKTRWICAPVWGPVSADLKAPAVNGDASVGSIIALKVGEEGDKLTLTPAWVSAGISSPAPPVIANGTVFTVSAGQYKKGFKPGGRAVLHALDSETGKEVYSSGDAVKAPAYLTGLTVANGRVFFSTTDNTLWAFGYQLEH